MKFSDLNLIPPLLGALTRKNYLQPTPIQAKAIPYILEGRDIFGCAQTGTGKTAAFALPLLQQLHANRHDRSAIRALVLAPTRELALQISESFSAYGSSLDIRHTVVFGGVSQHKQVQALKKGVDILVATPGRLLDLIQQGYIRLQAVEHFVLDEADRMLDMGFINDIRKIIARLPVKKQTLLFSATLPDEIRKLAASLLHQPVSVSVAPVSSAATTVQQSVYFVEKENKRSLLRHVISNNRIEHVLVFTRTKRGADKVVKELVRNGIKAEAIHGDKSQGARERALKGFKARSIRVLVATDIASRGIDVDKLTHVINFEIPEQAETYVHRIGRTGRAGEPGTALSFCSLDERSYLNDISRLIKKDIQVIDHPFSVAAANKRPRHAAA
ncbi:MAG: DEAD/DEAH box helicase [Bacteroidota bacterium]